MKVTPKKIPKRKIITVTLSYEPDMENLINNSYDLIAQDLEMEISSCWHYFDIIDIRIED